MKLHRFSWIRSLTERLSFFKEDASTTSMVRISHGGTWERVRQEKLAPDGLEFLEDKSEALWVEKSLSEFGKLRSLLPEGFSAYARLFHPAYLDDYQGQPVRWSTIASWTGRTVHPLMQFERIANLSESDKDLYKDPRCSERLHFDTRSLLFGTLVRIWIPCPRPLQGVFSSEGAATRISALSRTY